TFAHFSVSSIKSFRKSAEDKGIGTLPRLMIRSLTLGSARPALISRLSFSMMSCGVPRGAATPVQVLASYPGTISPMADHVDESDFQHSHPYPRPYPRRSRR